MLRLISLRAGVRGVEFMDRDGSTAGDDDDGHLIGDQFEVKKGASFEAYWLP
jgi:hypothetical protein